MASFYAELEVGGQRYPVRECQLGFAQATDGLGRVRTKVRHRLLHLTLDVPNDDLLLAWAYAPHKVLAGHITFFQADQRTARETVSFAAGQCVGYEETFVAGDNTAGAYRCALTITAEKLELVSGGPTQAFVPAAARDYAATPAATAALGGAAALPSKLERYTARLNLMQGARTKLAASPNEPAQTALTRLARNNVAVERAKLSAHVYKSTDVPSVPAPEGWHLLAPGELADKGVTPEMLLDAKSGFKAALYKSSFEQPPKLVIAYAGTEFKDAAGAFDTKDLVADLKQGIGLKTKQYNEAMKLADAVAKQVDPLDIETTGHSLGGGLASAASVVTGVKSYTFNAAGLHASTVQRAPYGVSRQAMQEKASLIDAYRSTSDPLNNFQNMSNLSRGRIAPKALGISHALAPDPKWKHTSGELVKGNPLKAATAMALDGHGIDPQMVDHIEHEKDQDTSTLTNYLGR